MKRTIHLTDAVNFVPIKNTALKDSFGTVTTQNGQEHLIVKIAATHAGIVTRNNSFYLPDKMKKGAATFTQHYNKPVLIHHDKHTDPLGRIIKSEYVDTSNAALSKLTNSVRNINPSIMDKFVTGKLSFIDSVHLVSNALLNNSVIDDPEYEGIGYILLTCDITDPEAIKKFQDGRYCTGSIGATTDQVICSVCKVDWCGDEGPCEHMPGQVYEGVKAVLIAGELKYDEYSVVNVPADQHSKVLQICVNGITDSYNMENSVGRSLDVELITDNINIDLTNQTEGEKMSDKAKYSAFIDKIDETMPMEQLDKLAIEKIFGLTDDKKLDALKTVRPEMDAEILETILKDSYSDSEALYKAMNETEWSNFAEDEAMEKIATEMLKDSKLSASQRKRLPNSSFCGPNRTFAVPDMAHIAVARKMLDVAQLSPASKERIKLAIDRKEKVLIALAQKVQTDETKQEPVKETPVSEEVKVCDSCESLKKQLADAITLKDQVLSEKEALVKQLDEANTQIKEKTDSVDALSSELKIVSDNVQVVTEQLVTLQSELNNELADKVVMYRQFSGENIEDIAKAKTTLCEFSKEKIVDELKSLTSKVDMKRIVDSINSGIAHTPQGEVQNPVLNIETNVQKNIMLELKREVPEKDTVMKEYVRLSMGGSYKGRVGTQAAEEYLQDVKQLIASNKEED